MKKPATRALAAALIAACGGVASAAYDEALDGDLSGAFASPTPISFSFGANSVSGQVGANGNTGASNGSDGDYFSFTVPIGSEITSLTVDEYVTTEDRSFLGYRSVPFTDQTNVDDFLLFSGSASNILADATGLVSLGPGTHYFWVQETANVTVDYTLTFTQVPEPAALSLASLGAVAALSRRRKR